MKENKYEEIIKMFHQTWDNFPGPARLIDSKHTIIACNELALDSGFEEGLICSRINDPKIHRGCKMSKMFNENKAQVDRVIPDRIRGWIPIKDYPELTIHFTVMIPEE